MIRQLFVVLQHYWGGEGETGAKKLEVWGWLNNFVTDCRPGFCDVLILKFVVTSLEEF